MFINRRVGFVLPLRAGKLEKLMRLEKLPSNSSDRQSVAFSYSKPTQRKMSFALKKLIKISEDWFGGSDYYRVIYTVYVLGGVWGLKKERAEKNIYYLALYRLAQFLTLTVCACSGVSCIYEAYRIRKSIDKLTYNLAVIVFLFLSLFRFFFLFMKKREFEDMLDLINGNLYLEGIGTNRRDLRLLKSGERSLIRISKVFYFLQFLSVIFKILCHSVTERSLPIPFPYVERIESPIYEILFATEVLCLIYFVAVVIAQTMVTYGVLIRVSQHFVILSENITDIGKVVGCLPDAGDFGFGRKKSQLIGRKEDARWEQERIFAMLRNCAIHHREILKVMKRTSYLLRESFFFEIFGGGMLLVDLFFHVTLNVQQIKEAALLITYQAIFSVSALLGITITCYYGSQVQTRSIEAANALYSIDWQEMDLRNKQMIIFMQMALWKYPVIKAGNFIINFKMYVKFLQSIYSYLAFMQNTL